MKDIFKKFGFLLILLVTACDLDGDLENPNQISVANADVDLIMNSVQLDFADFFYNASTSATPLMRMDAMTGGYFYSTANQPTGYDGLWTQAYSQILINTETLIPLAQAKGFTTHVAVAKILQAYTYMILVDLFGDVPQVAALTGGAGEFNPKADAGSDVYAKAIALLDEAKVELAKTGADVGGALSRDIYYGGNRTRWNALANTLQLRAWMNISMISSRTAEANTKINALLALDLIDTEAENFTYKYSTVTVPNSRHPLYNQYYGAIKGSAGGYFGNWFLAEMYRGKGLQDPRWRYYFYRQVGSITTAKATDPKSVGCIQTLPAHYVTAGINVTCTFEPGFYGRDHGDASGTNPDSPFITAAGVYPAGGKADTNPTTNRTYQGPTVRGDGANGAGIQPIFMSFFTDFMKAEYMARNGNTADAKTQLTTAILNSITQVKNFATAKGQTLPAGLEPSTSAYKTAVEGLYDAAANKLDVIGKEFYLASFGNGLETYNLYRRTGAPRNMQPTLSTNPGIFLRSLVYPSNYVNLNNKAVQKDYAVKNTVFWDTNPENLN